MSAENNSFEKFEICKISRADVNKAEYNPRKIKKDNKERLKERIKKVGLLAPIVWNRQTGNIVSGHQRIDILDTLSKSKDYSLTVAAVDLDEKTEKEQAIFFNNVSAMGEWDFEKLADLFDEDINMVAAGFSKAELEVLFDADPAEIFNETLEALEPPPRIINKEKEETEKVWPEPQEGTEKQESTEKLQDEVYFGQGDKVREGMQHRKRRAAVSGFRENCDFFFVVVFKSQEERDSFLADHGIEEAQFLNGSLFREAIENKPEYES
jgi:ParB-like chromosome segregation protein Spo0J